MSGGHFNYNQYKIRQIADEVEQLILSNNDESEDEYGYKKGYFYNDEVIKEFKTGLNVLRLAEIYTQRIDWLVSGDDSEDIFLSRLEEELKGLMRLKGLHNE